MVSNIFYFHPDPWGNDPILTFACFSKGLVQPPTSYIKPLKYWNRLSSHNHPNLMELYIIYYSIIWETLNHQVAGFLNHQNKNHLELTWNSWGLGFGALAAFGFLRPQLGRYTETLMASRNPGGKVAPVELGTVEIPIFIGFMGFSTIQKVVVWDFFHQQYVQYGSNEILGTLFFRGFAPAWFRVLKAVVLFGWW